MYRVREQGEFVMNGAYIDGRKFHFEGSFLTEPIDLGRIKLYQLGELCCESGYEIEEHLQVCHEISYIVSGKGEFADNGRTVQVSGGDILVNPHEHTHSIRAKGQEALRFVYVGLMINSANDVSEMGLIESFFKNVDKLKVTDKLDILTPFIRCLEEFYILPKCNRVMIEAYIIQIMVMAYRLYTLNQTLPLSPPIGESRSVGQPAYAAIRYIDQNILNLQDIQVIASMIGYNHCYLSHVFKEKMNMTLKQYISRKRIQKGMELLKSRQYTVTQIAEKLNYANVQSFSRSFKQIAGIYPTEYVENGMVAPNSVQVGADAN